MNLKYYLRGLGIGIVVSTLIVGIAADHRSQSLSDEEVRQRVRELGMVEASGVLADEIPAATAEKTAVKENVSAEPSPKPEEAKSETTDASKEEPKENVEKTADEESASAESTPKPEEAKNETTDTPKAESKAEPKENVDKTADEESASAEPSTKQEETKNETTDASKEEPKAESTKIADEMVTEESATVTITIQGGEGSYSVCKKLEEAGLVESAAAFDRYLYEKRL